MPVVGVVEVRGDDKAGDIETVRMYDALCCGIVGRRKKRKRFSKNFPEKANKRRFFSREKSLVGKGCSRTSLRPSAASSDEEGDSDGGRRTTEDEEEEAASTWHRRKRPQRPPPKRRQQEAAPGK